MVQYTPSMRVPPPPGAGGPPLGGGRGRGRSRSPRSASGTGGPAASVDGGDGCVQEREWGRKGRGVRSEGIPRGGGGDSAAETEREREKSDEVRRREREPPPPFWPPALRSPSLTTSPALRLTQGVLIPPLHSVLDDRAERGRHRGAGGRGVGRGRGRGRRRGGGGGGGRGRAAVGRGRGRHGRRRASQQQGEEQQAPGVGGGSRDCLHATPHDHTPRRKAAEGRVTKTNSRSQTRKLNFSRGGRKRQNGRRPPPSSLPAYRLTAAVEPFYAGGALTLLPDGRVVCACGDEVKVKEEGGAAARRDFLFLSSLSRRNHRHHPSRPHVFRSSAWRRARWS